MRILAGRGPELRCRGWRQEGLLRMLENVLEIGERPEDLVVYAARGRAARNWESFHGIVRSLRSLSDGETLVVQSGKPIGVFRTSAGAPLVVMACGNIVGHYATQEYFDDLESRGLIMWGGLTAGDWQYIGFQGVLEGVYELLCAVAAEHFGGSLAGRLVLSAGLGGMGAAQPLGITMAGGRGLVVEVDEAKCARALARGHVSFVATNLDEALGALGHGASPLRRSDGTGVVALVGNAAAVYAELAERAVVPDVVTDLTAAHDPVFGYCPLGASLAQWSAQRARDPVETARRARESMAVQVEAMLALKAAGAVVFENGNNLRVQAQAAGAGRAFEIDGFAERYLRPLFCRGIGPFRWVALSGEPADIAELDGLAAKTAIRPEVASWLELARRHVDAQGLPARSCWLGHGERSRFALATNALVAEGRLAGPVAFTRDHFDSGGMTHPHIGTEQMADGSSAISDWPILDALVVCASGADLVAVHAGGAGYAGYMQSAGVTIIADGTESAARRLRSGLDADSGLGILRYADAGYERAQGEAARFGLGLGGDEEVLG
ncbi:MAG: urocanate hydratase [Actinomycetota bacterium]|nr:urocanate hydratase [Actinomycetota bacterium]